MTANALQKDLPEEPGKGGSDDKADLKPHEEGVPSAAAANDSQRSRPAAGLADQLGSLQLNEK